MKFDEKGNRVRINYGTGEAIEPFSRKQFESRVREDYQTIIKFFGGSVPTLEVKFWDTHRVRGWFRKSGNLIRIFVGKVGQNYSRQTLIHEYLHFLGHHHGELISVGGKRQWFAAYHQEDTCSRVYEEIIFGKQ